MRQRWAREHLNSEQACEALIPAREAMRITRISRPHVALQRLASLPLAAGWTSASASLEETQSGTRVRLKWPKVAKYQGWDALDTGTSEADASPQDAPSVVPSPVSRLAAHEEQELTPSELAASEPAAISDPLERPLRLLNREPGSLEAKRAWLAEELPLIEAEAAQIEPNGKTASQHFRSTLIRYWRQSRLPQRKLDDRRERLQRAAMGALMHKGVLE